MRVTIDLFTGSQQQNDRTQYLPIKAVNNGYIPFMRFQGRQNKPGFKSGHIIAFCLLVAFIALEVLGVVKAHDAMRYPSDPDQQIAQAQSLP